MAVLHPVLSALLGGPDVLRSIDFMYTLATDTVNYSSVDIGSEEPNNFDYQVRKP